MGGDDSRDWSDPEQQAAPKPRGRPRKSVPQQVCPALRMKACDHIRRLQAPVNKVTCGRLLLQAAATSEEPAKGVLGKGPAGQRRPDQDSKQTSEQDYSAYKRSKSAAADDEVASAGQDADTVQEHLPAKRRRTPLFSIQDIIAAEKGHGEYRTSSRAPKQLLRYWERPQLPDGCLPGPGTANLCQTTY